STSTPSPSPAKSASSKRHREAGGAFRLPPLPRQEGPAMRGLPFFPASTRTPGTPRLRLRPAASVAHFTIALPRRRLPAHARTCAEQEQPMPRGDKSSYTGKQKRQAEHIEESEKARGRGEEAAERIAWATVNKQDGGGKQSGSGRKSAARKSAKKSAT